MTITQTKKVFLAAALGLMTAGLVAGCGDDEEGGGSAADCSSCSDDLKDECASIYDACVDEGSATAAECQELAVFPCELTGGDGGFNLGGAGGAADGG